MNKHAIAENLEALKMLLGVLAILNVPLLFYALGAFRNPEEAIVAVLVANLGMVAFGSVIGGLVWIASLVIDA